MSNNANTSESLEQQLWAKNIVGNEKVSGDGEPIYSYNPKTNEKLNPSYFEISKADLQKALSLSHQAFLAYRLVSNDKRSQFLSAIADNLENSRQALVQRAMMETALPEARLNGELTRTINQLMMFANLIKDNDYLDIRIDKALPDRTPPRADIRYQKIPLGPVAVFGASNFPLAFSVAGGDTAAALAAGCSVVVKAHNAHLGTSDLAGQAIAMAAKQCNMPDGVFCLLYGQGNEIGQTIVKNPNIRAVGFTGSRQGGLSLMNIANQRAVPIPVYAEMSSINPIYVLSQKAKQEGASVAKALVDSMLMGAGQFCTSPGLVFIPKTFSDEFLASAKQALEEAGAQTMLTQGIAQNFANKTDELKNTAIKLLATAQDNKEANACVAHLFVSDYKTFADNPKLTDEVFGSSAIVVLCDEPSQMIDSVEKLEGQLTASIFAHSNDKQEEQLTLVHALEQKVGRLIFNAFGTGVEVCSAMVHGGPFPATSDGRSTSVGTAAIERFLRPVCYQDVPEFLLPEAIK